MLKFLINCLNRFFSIFYTQKNENKLRNLKNYQGNEQFSLKDLNKIGLNVKSINRQITHKENTIITSQLPAHIFPWVLGLKKGLYQITFSPEVLSQIQSGALTVSGGVARNTSGQIGAIGKNISPFMVASPIMLYQIGVIAFGAYHLQLINRSLKKVNKKLDEISEFQHDKRSAQINSYLQEFYHLSKGIVEFKQSGNMTEILNRIKKIQYIRMMNLSHLLHLQQNIADQQNKLENLSRRSWSSSEEEFHNLTGLMTRHKRNILDYQKSLTLDIFLTKVEVSFSICKSHTETKSRLSSQKEQMTFFKSKVDSFEKILNKKIPSLIKKTFFSRECSIKYKRRKIRSLWKQIKNNAPQFLCECRNQIKSVENILNCCHTYFILEKNESSEGQV